MSRAAELYRRQVAQGLDGNPQAALKARVFLSRMVGRKNLAGAIAGWWSPGPLDAERWRALQGPGDIW